MRTRQPCVNHTQNEWPRCAFCDPPADKRTRLPQLRDALVERAHGRCEWPHCGDWGREMAHLTHRGMGGSKAADWLGNVALLCRNHHDLLDGRTALGTARWELNETLRRTIAAGRPKGEPTCPSCAN